MIMKRLFASIITLLATLPILSQGWPEKYDGVMLQGFYWDSYSQSQWTRLEKQADELSQYFKLVWLPQSGNCGGWSMGYDDLYWFPGHYTSSFGTEAELRSLINTFKEKGIGTIADVVINHRKELSNWVVFPKETYRGVTYELKSTDIVSDDECKDWAKNNGYTLGNPEGKDEATNIDCENWKGMRDLDHSSANVQTNVKAYLQMLLEDLDYAGFRYDMVKGYPAKYTGMYNAYANPTFSVGEYWNGYAPTVKKWIDGTKVDGKVMSAAFDFSFRYTVRNALRGSDNDNNNNNWKQDANYTLLGAESIVSDVNYRRYAVTFVENHDTEKRSEEEQDPIRKDTLAANAYLLAMPGTPCIFLKHWIDCKRDIKAMIDVRKAVGLHNQSTYIKAAQNKNYYAVMSTGTKGEMVCAVGSGVGSYAPNGNFVKVLSGYHYDYYMKKSMETAWVDLPSGEYDGQQQALLTAVSTNSDAQLVYTTDGSTPTASSQKVASGSKITINGDETLKVGILIGSTVSGIVTRVYKKAEPESLPIAECTVSEGEVCAFFEAPSDWKNDICCWAWSDTPSENFTFAIGSWPGVLCTLLGVAENGNKVWKWTWDGTKQNNSTATQPAKIIFNNTPSPQTGDLTFSNGGYYNKNGLVKVIPMGINETLYGNQKANGKIYNLSGQQVERPSKGIYIINGKKVVIN